MARLVSLVEQGFLVAQFVYKQDALASKRSCTVGYHRLRGLDGYPWSGQALWRGRWRGKKHGRWGAEQQRKAFVEVLMRSTNDRERLWRLRSWLVHRAGVGDPLDCVALGVETCGGGSVVRIAQESMGYVVC